MEALLRRFTFPIALARTRIGNRTVAAAILGAGIACAAALLAGVLGGSRVAETASLMRALARVPEDQRALTAVYADLGVPRRGVTVGDIDALARNTVGRLAGRPPARVLQFKLLTFDGVPVNLAAADDLRLWVRLGSGRLPQTCGPARCEVIRVGGRGPVPSQAGLRLEVVGEGRLTSPALFGQLAGSEGARVGESFGLEREPPFVLAEGFDELASVPALTSFYRTYAWVAPLEPTSIPPWEADDFAATVTSGRSALKARSVNADLVAPVDTLSAAREDGRRASQRLLVIGGQAVALLLAFAILAAASMRRDTEAAWQRLTWRGARRWQLGLMSGTEAAASAILGGAVGWVIGTAVTAVLSERAGAPAGGVLRHSTLSVEGIGALTALVAVSVALLVVALWAPAIQVRRSSISALDTAALGALVAVAIIVVTGPGTGLTLLLLPGLITFAGAVACARLMGPVLQVLGRLGRAHANPLRLAVLMLARRPGHAAVAVSFLAVSIGLALFAVAYRTSLVHGNADQAAYAFPLEVAVREKLAPDGLVAPLEAASFDRYAKLGQRAVPVIRQRGSVTSLGGPAQLTVLALPARTLPSLAGWRADFSAQPRGELAELLARPGAALRAVPLPAGATTLSVHLALAGGDVTLEAAVRTPRGTFAFVDLGSTRGAGRQALRAAIPAGARGGELVALSIFRAATVEGHGSDFTRLDGTLVIAEIRADAATIVSNFDDWVGTENVDVSATGDGRARLRFLVGNSNLAGRFRLRQPTDGRLVPVLATPRIAAAAGPDGALPVRLPGAPLRARVVGTVARFPGTYGEAVVADANTVRTALNAVNPGAAVTNEVWIDGDPDAIMQRLGRPPFDVLAVASRTELERELGTDPLTRGALWTLVAAAAAAAFLALAGLALLVIADRRDEDRELADLEAQGLGPAALRKHVRLRSAVVTALGLVAGLVLAAVLAVLVIDLVAVSANRTVPEPPLVLALDWPLMVAVCTAYAAVAAALILTGTRRIAR
jgi:hypothetical protein